MGLVRVVLWGYECLRCGHKWVPRGLGEQDGKKPPEPAETDAPRVCPKCKSPYWSRPRKDAAK